MRSDREPVQTRITGNLMFPLRDKPLHVQRRTLEEDFFPHDHDFVETILITEGEGYHCTKQGERLLRPGDLILMAPGVWHAYRVPERITVYNCCFGTTMLSRELAAVQHNKALRRLFSSGEESLDRESILITRVEGASFRRSVNCLRRMERIRDAGEMNTRFLEQVGYLTLYLCEIAQSLPERMGSAVRPANSQHPAVIRCRALLTERYAEDWSLALLAEELHIAPRYLIRLFHESVGMAPMAYLSRVRAERASLLLVNSLLPVAEIGRRVGWADPNYFARRFRGHFDMSATEFRERFTRHGMTGELSREV